MLKQIASWDPKADLRQLSRDERIRWRRVYTIALLYDMVNVSLSFCKGLVGWAENSAYFRHFGLPFFGLNELASFTASLAKQNYGTDITKRILPHHVFQLQCIVDSMTVSRGWVVGSYSGDTLTAPPDNFVVRRDLDSFRLNKEDEDGRGWIQSLRDVIRILASDDYFWENAPGERVPKLLGFFHDCLGLFLGNSLLNPAIHRSCFPAISCGGLWDFSPFLCGVELLEGLELTYPAGMYTWTKMPEVIVVVHLYNKLLKQGYIKDHIETLEIFLRLFSDQFFRYGERPSSKFCSYFVARVRHAGKERAGTASKRFLPTLIGFDPSTLAVANWHSLLEPRPDALFGQKLFAHHLRAADYDIDRVPYELLPASLRIANMHLLRPMLTEADFRPLEDVLGENAGTMRDFLNCMGRPKDGKQLGKNAPKGTSRHAQSTTMPCSEILSHVEFGIRGDVHDEFGLLRINYFSFACDMRFVYDEMIRELKGAGDHLYNVAFHGRWSETSQCRKELALLALMDDNEECLQIMAKLLVECHIDVWTYWKPREKVEEEIECPVT